MAYLFQDRDDRSVESKACVAPGQAVPNVCASFLMGLVVLASFVGFVYFELYEAQTVVTFLVAPFPLTAATLAHALLWVFSLISVLIKCCVRGCSGNERIAFHHWGWAFLAEIFFVGSGLLMWYLWQPSKDHSRCFESYNECVVLFSVDLVLLMLFTIPWYHERTDVAMGIFVFVIGVANGLLLWDLEQTQFSFSRAHWEALVTISAIVLSLTIAMMLVRKSMSPADASIAHLLFAHTTLGFVLTAAATTALEVIPNWSAMKAYFKDFNWDISWRYIVAFAIFSLFILSLKGLARYSDSLTTHYTFKLSILLPLVARILQVTIEDDGMHADWKNIIRDHPVKSAGVLIFVAAFLYWFIRVFTLTCCFYRKHRY